VRKLKTYSDSAIYPVQKKDRVLGPVDIALLWAGSAIAVNVWYSGGYLSPLGWIPGIVLILAGSFVGSLIFALAGVLGTDLGVPSMVTVRPSFGLRGSQLISALNYVALIGWTAWMIFINASAVEQINEILFGFSGFPVWIILCGVLCTTLALVRAEGWKWFTRTSVVALLIMTLVINIVVFSSYGWETLASKPTWGMDAGVGFDLALIIPLSWAPLAADYMRFSRSHKGGFLGALFGQGSVNSWFYITGLACALAFGVYDPTVYVALIGPIFAIIALLVIWLGTITTTFLDIYSANVSLINIAPALKEWQGSLITGVLGTIMAFLPWLDAFVGFLNIIGALFVPLFAIVIADYFLVRGRRYDIAELYLPKGRYWYRGGFNFVSFAIWLFGVAIYFVFMVLTPWLGATLPTFITAFLIYVAYHVFR
jgi:putative hydroxymethylpyrimidine transporter CytX